MAMRYRYYFIEALVLTLFLFLIGFLIGMGIEQNRNEKLANSYLNTESEILDLGAQLDITNLGRFTCSELIKRNFYIGNQIYEQALIFEEYENSAILTKSQLVKEHKKFDALRTLFWINSIKIKDRCGNNVFDTVVYLYNYPTEEIDELAKQRVMARITQEIKSKYEKEVILIPIAKNLNITSLNTLIEYYDYINESTLLIVNEKETFLSNQTEQIRSYFKIDF
jgi:hypothetical protein